MITRQTATAFDGIDFAIVDVETTGWSPEEASITEIGAVRVSGGRVRQQFTALVNPGQAIPPDIAALTGISDAMVAFAPPIAAVLPGFLDFARGCVLTAHNAPFDIGFLSAACGACGVPWPACEVIDTVVLAGQVLGEDDVPNFILLPRAAEELKIPFVASGGMADGRSLVAALSLGADGMNMGTRFIATKEAPVHEHVKQALLAATELDTRLVMRPLRNTERVLKNAAVDRLLEKERALGPNIKFEDILGEVGGVYPRIMKDGEMDAGAWSCGMVAGLIHDIPTVKELIDRTITEAESIVAGRLKGFMKA